MIATLSRIIYCPRMWMHVPVGTGTVWLFTQSPELAWMFWVGFLLYEVWQCFRIRDNAHEDILGALVGLIATSVVFYLLGRL